MKRLQTKHFHLTVLGCQRLIDLMNAKHVILQTVLTTQLQFTYGADESFVFGIALAVFLMSFLKRNSS